MVFQTYHGHVRFNSAQRARPSYRGEIFAESGRVERVAEGQKRRQTLERGIVQAIEVREITGLVYLVDIRLFRRKGNVLADLVADIAEEGVVDEVLDHGVFISSGV
jgi:hypothetical protein